MFLAYRPEVDQGYRSRIHIRDISGCPEEEYSRNLDNWSEWTLCCLDDDRIRDLERRSSRHSDGTAYLFRSDSVGTDISFHTRT